MDRGILLTRTASARCVPCREGHFSCEGYRGIACLSCQFSGKECELEDGELEDEPRPGQNTAKPADIPDSSNRTAGATPVKAKATPLKATRAYAWLTSRNTNATPIKVTKATPVKQPTHGADIRFLPPDYHPQKQPEVTASRDLTEDTDSEFEDEEVPAEGRTLEWVMNDIAWNREREGERNRTAAQAPPTDHEIPRLITLDTRAKDENFSPAGIRYMKHHLNIFVDHLKTLGFDTSKINMDSPLGIPRVDPRFLPATQNQHLPVDNSGHQQKKRKDEGGDDADDDNGEGPSKRARV